MITIRNLEWFPRLRTISIDAENEEEDLNDLTQMRSELNEIRSVVYDLKKYITEISGESSQRTRENTRKLIKKSSTYF